DLVVSGNRHIAAHDQYGDDGFGIAVPGARRIDQQERHVGIRNTAPGRIDHGAIKPSPGRKNPWEIEEGELRPAVDRNAGDPRARRLHLRGNDRNLGADEAVDQSRLADIRGAEHRDEPATRRFAHGFAIAARSAAAAARSASRFELPLATTGSWPCTRNSTSKLGLWAGPSD